MYYITHSIGLFGMNCFPVIIESEVTRGVAMFDIAGLADAGVKESRARVRSAFTALGVPFPHGRVILNLVPADVKKTGSSFDLAICVAVLQAAGVIDCPLEDSVFVGELGLHGTLHSIRGVLNMTMLAKQAGRKNIYVPEENVAEACVIDGINVYGIRDVNQLIGHLLGKEPLQPHPPTFPDTADAMLSFLDMEDVRGQYKARQGIEVAAAGSHNILLIGAPGAGKSMIAHRIPSILPPMSREEMLETTQVYSVAGQLSKEQPLITRRPFRSPHHTVSSAGLIGGGSVPTPGEISLAHNGVLFLDELAEFDRRNLDVLRQPLEAREITIARAAGTAVYPCNFMLVAATNPCPCGYYGSEQKPCRCTPNQINNYLNRLSGPLLDRFDMRIDIDPVNYDDLLNTQPMENSAVIQQRVVDARERQARRFRGTGIHSNAMIPDNLLKEYCALDEYCENALKLVGARYHLSARTYSRVLRVARSCADIYGRDAIERSDISFAVSFRGIDSKYLQP